MKKFLNLATLVFIIFSSFLFASENESIIEIARIESSKTVNHSSDTGGKILKIYYENGDFIKKGSVIMAIENKQITAAYKEAESRYETAKINYEKTAEFSEDRERLNLEKAKRALITAKMNLQKAENGVKEEEIDRLKLNVETAKVNYETIKKNFEKNRVLFESQSISEQNFLQIKAQFEASENTYKSAQKALMLAEKGADQEDINTLKAILDETQFNYDLSQKNIDKKRWTYDINLSQSSMETAKAAYDFAKTRYNDLKIKAESNGIIAALDIDAGNKIAPNQNLFSVIDNENMILKIKIEERYLPLLNQNTKISIFVNSLNRSFSGSLASVNPIGDEKTQKFEIEIIVSNKDYILKDGMHGEVTLSF